MGLPMSQWRTGCSVTDCTRKHYAKGFCRLHWERNHLHGDPMAQKVLAGATVEERLKHYSASVGACLEWTGHRDRDGYGTITIEGKPVRAHRAAYETVHGPIASGLVVRHRCDNPPCILPVHLELGTNGDNQNDKKVRRRSTYGELNPGAKLTEEQVRGIRNALAQGDTHKNIAAQYGCGKSTVGRIYRGESWAYLEVS